jgi:hypothetical protein
MWWDAIQDVQVPRSRSRAHHAQLAQISHLQQGIRYGRQGIQQEWSRSSGDGIEREADGANERVMAGCKRRACPRFEQVVCAIKKGRQGGVVRDTLGGKVEARP